MQINDGKIILVILAVFREQDGYSEMTRPNPKPKSQTNRKTVVVAGASGFVGRDLIERLRTQYRVVGLTRSPARKDQDGIEWRNCDLFSVLQTENALRGADYAVYLVHSMSPAARLSQGSFADIDLLLADNFARAARHNRVKQILYIGGLIPEGPELSEHLKSRLEVEHALAATGVPVTTFRAGLILGAGGSSFQMMVRLVDRLPIMICPAWTRSLSCPVELAVVVDAIQRALGTRSFYRRSIDLAGPEVISYVNLMRLTAGALGKRRFMLTVPLFAPWLSLLWIRIFSGQSMSLIRPLVQSLRHDMLPRAGHTFSRRGRPLSAVLEEAARIEPRSPTGRGAPPANKKRRNNVCSVQRLPLPAGSDALEVAVDYAGWLPRFLRPLLDVQRHPPGRILVRLRFLETPLLELTYAPERSTAGRALYYITGGWLRAKSIDGPPGRLEFRECPNHRHLLSIVLDFEPALPWPVYLITQAPAHLFVMRAFGRHLGRAGRQTGPSVL